MYVCMCIYIYIYIYISICICMYTHTCMTRNNQSTALYWHNAQLLYVLYFYICSMYKKII